MPTSISSPALQVEGLTVSYDTAPVLLDVDLGLSEGVMMGVVGPNGAGKSTLLKAVLGVIPKVAGRIRVFGRSLKAEGQKIAYVPQRREVDWDFPTTVFDLVLMGTYGSLGWLKRPGPTERAATHEALAKVEMTEFAKAQISELSGGQQQRVFLARALVQKAELYLMDEPFAGIDASTEKALVNLLHEIRAKGKSLLVVHHDLSTVPSYFDQVVLLNKEVIAIDTVEKAFTKEALEETYGGPLHHLSHQ